jgi:hypothetical protein
MQHLVTAQKWNQIELAMENPWKAVSTDRCEVDNRITG